METLELGRMVAALLVVLALIGGLALIARRLIPRLQAAGHLPTRRLRQVEALMLDPRNRVVLMELDGREMLIGVGPNGPVRLDSPGEQGKGANTSDDKALSNDPAGRPVRPASIRP